MLTLSIIIIPILPSSAAAISIPNSSAALKNDNQNITKITANNNNDNNNAFASIIGKLIYEVQGRIVSQRITPPDTTDGTYKMEVSYSGNGILNGINVTEMWTFVNTYKPNGVIQGVGQGGLSTKDHTEIASTTGYGRGYIKENGNTIVFPTVQLYSTDSTGKLAFLKTLIGVSEWKVDNIQNIYSYRMWELK
ncbi:MAG: hypothetical protein ACTHKC_02605 [Candidatus Nitrosocosmicus sp.]